MSATYVTLQEVYIACGHAMRALVTDRPIPSEAVALAATAAMHEDHTGQKIATDASVVAACYTQIAAEGLTLRDGLLADILARLTALENA